MNIGEALLGEDIREVRQRRVAQSMRQQRSDYLALRGDTHGAIVHMLTKCGPMSKKLLFIAIPNHLPSTIGYTANRMVRKGEAVLEERGAIQVVKLVRGAR